MGIPAYLLVYAGRIVKEKNIDFLLRVARLLKKENIDFRLFIVGTGVDEENLRRQSILLGLEDCIIFTGYIETQGLVMIEAMYNATPAVVVRALGAPDMVNDEIDGFLVPEDEEAFAEKVKLLLNWEDLRQRMSKEARKKALTFSGRDWVLRQIDCYCRTRTSERTKSERKKKVSLNFYASFSTN